MKKTILMTLLTPSFSFIVRFRNGIRKIHANQLQNIPNTFYSSTSRRLRSTQHENNEHNSVTGMIYEVENNNETSGSCPTVQLYTKEGCTLCDKAKDVLGLLREEQPHSLETIDITDPDKTDIFDKYKWDIPVLHLNGLYWTKHRLTVEEARSALEEAKAGTFKVQRGEPDAAAMEEKMEERQRQAKP